MKSSVCIGILAGLGLSQTALLAGTVYFLDNRPEVHGKLTLNATSIHVDGNPASDVNLADVLEADFSDSDFHLDYFSSEDNPDKLPPAIQGHDVGPVDKPGSYVYSKGELTLTSSGPDVFGPVDKCYFLAQPWNMPEGRWTVRVKNRTDTTTTVGVMMRTGLEPGANGFNYGLTRDNGFMTVRRVTDSVPGRDTRFQNPDVPGWIRLTCYFNFLMAMETSNDGKNWEISAQNGDLRQPSGDVLGKTSLVGLFATGVSGAQPGTVVLDQIMFAPSPAETDTVRPGVLLRSGSYLAGWYNQLDNNGGNFNRNSQSVAVTVAQVSAVAWEPTPLRQIADVSKESGVIMKNGDFMASELQTLSGAGAQMTSVVLGPMDFIYTAAMRACVLNPFRFDRSDFEVRLKDGSEILASSVKAADKQLVIHEVSGPDVTIAPDEVAEFRSGSARAEPLMRAAWKAASAPAADPAPAAKDAKPGAPSGAKTTDNAPAPKAAPVESKTSTATPIQAWQGPNQEHILAAPTGTAIEFPLAGTFSAVAMRVALLSGSADAQAVIRVMDKDHEIGRVGADQGRRPAATVECAAAGFQKHQRRRRLLITSGAAFTNRSCRLEKIGRSALEPSTSRSCPCRERRSLSRALKGNWSLSAS